MEIKINEIEDKINENVEILQPYIITELSSVVTVDSVQLNNSLYQNIKQNLIDVRENRCYKNYGFIEKIYEITNSTKGIMQHENPYGSVVFNVNFSCKLWNPMKNTFVIAMLDKYNRKILNTKCGPIKIIIEDTQINSHKFTFNRKNNLIYKQNDDVINNGAYLKVMILSKIFNDSDEIIIAKGYLDDIPTEDEIKKFEK
jgi:DNA-directed RNA polymerase subunit E'/Rpb7